MFSDRELGVKLPVRLVIGPLGLSNGKQNPIR
jgi:hypothetical protein